MDDQPKDLWAKHAEEGIAVFPSSLPGAPERLFKVCCPPETTAAAVLAEAASHWPEYTFRFAEPEGAPHAVCEILADRVHYLLKATEKTMVDVAARAARTPKAGSLHADHYRPAVCCFNCTCFTAASWSPSEERLGQCSVPGHGAVSAFHVCDRFPNGTSPRGNS